MKILFVMGNISNGGAQRVLAVIGSQLSFVNDVYFIVYSKDEKEYPLNSSVHVTYIRDSLDEYEHLNEIKKAIILRKYIKEIKPDVAVGFIQGGYGLFISSIGMNFPKIASLRNNPEIVFSKKGFKANLNKIWFSKADAVVIQTKSQLDLIKKYNWKNCTVISNPVSNEAIDCFPLNYSHKIKRMVMIGRLTEQKDYPMAIKAMVYVIEKHPDIILDVFGEGHLRDQLQDLINSLNLNQNVYLKGWSNNVLQELVKSDLYIMTSKYEGMPNSLMEAMAVGLPCISTNCKTGPADLIQDSLSGFLIPLGDSEYLSKKIIEIIEMDYDNRKTIGMNAHHFIKENFGTDKIAKDWENLFSKLINMKVK